jgi:class 3 adenylate cyclase
VTVVTSLPRGTVTLVFTDVEGSTELLRALGRTVYAETLEQHRRILRDVFGTRGGVEVEMQGDSSFFAFPYARDATIAAAEAQVALSAHEWPQAAIAIRVGIHTGEPEANADADAYTGLDVHRAARVMSLGHGGQVLLSARTTDLVEGELGPGIGVAPLGAYRLKDFDRPEEIAQLEVAGLPATFAPLKAERVALHPPAPAPSSHGAPKSTRRRRRLAVLSAVAAVVAVGAAVALALRHPSSGPVTNAVVAIDPRKNAVTQRVAVGNAPVAVAAGAGGVWVVNSRDGTLTEVSPDGHAVRTIGTTGVPTDVATTPGALWVAGLPNVVLKLDPRNDAVRGRVSVRAPRTPFSPLMWLAVQGGRVFVSAQDRLATIDAATSRTSLHPWPTPDWGPIAIDGQRVWESSNHVLYRLDRTGTRVTGSLPFPEGELAIGDGFLWALSPAAGVVAQIDPVTTSVVRTYPVGAVPTDVAYGEGAVWVPSQDGTVTRIDPKAEKVVASIHVGGTPQAVAVGFGRVWVTVA